MGARNPLFAVHHRHPAGLRTQLGDVGDWVAEAAGSRQQQNCYFSFV